MQKKKIPLHYAMNRDFFNHEEIGNGFKITRPCN